MSDTTVANRQRPARSLWRLLACIRLDEVLVLQGTPWLGALLALEVLTLDGFLRGLVFVAGSLCLVAHVFVLNDWAGIEGDLRDPQRSARTFSAKGASRGGIGWLAIGLLVLSLLLLGALGPMPFLLALAILVLSALYSAPGVHMKGRPVLSSVLHLVGGTLHFLLGHAAFAPVTASSVGVACFFGLIFAAGHLVHETRGHEGDALNHIQTNAVAFGKARSFGAAGVLFSAAYALLAVLVLWGALPRVLLVALVFYPVRLHASWRAMRAGLSFYSLLRFQACYRRLYALIGVLMAGSAALRLLGAGP